MLPHPSTCVKYIVTFRFQPVENLLMNRPMHPSLIEILDTLEDPRSDQDQTDP